MVENRSKGEKVEIVSNTFFLKLLGYQRWLVGGKSIDKHMGAWRRTTTTNSYISPEETSSETTTTAT